MVPVFLMGLTAGLDGPVRSLLPAFSQPSLLDYSRAPFRSFPSLRSGFVDQALGDGGSHLARSGGLDPASGVIERLVVEHALTNDDFADAKRIPRVPYTAKTDTTGATRQDEPADCSSTGGTVWYRYRPSRNEALIADTMGSESSTTLGVFIGSTLERLRLVACATGTTGEVAVPAVGGETYYFQVGEGGGKLVFNLTQQTTTRASVTSTGAEGLHYSSYPAMSGDGRYVAFMSRAALDPNYPIDGPCEHYLPPYGGQPEVTERQTCPVNVYVRDRVAHTTRLVSILQNGQPANDSPARQPSASISDDGRYVVFESAGDNETPTTYKGLGALYKIYMRDLALDKTTVVSVSSSGTVGDGNSSLAHISGNGRYVAFSSTSTNLVEKDTNEVGDVFVHDRVTGVTTRASVSSSERQANGDECESTVVGSDIISISATGRFVAFWSCATNLVPGDTNRRADVFLRDRVAGITTRISVSSTGRQANGDTVFNFGIRTTISADGRFAAFASSATNLVPGDTNGGDDIFVRDLVRRRTTRASVSSSGQQADRADVPSTATPIPGFQPAWPLAFYSYSMTRDGRYVTFSSQATNLVRGDTNGVRDVFMHDRKTGTTTRVSITYSGHQANGESESLVISADGRSVAWWSHASNLVPRDTNGEADVFVHEIPRPGEALRGWY